MSGVAIGLCLLAFLTTFLSGRKLLAAGYSVTLFWGYTYGITRANVPAAASHFIFDSSVIGLYMSLALHKQQRESLRRSKLLNDWVTVLIGWTLLIALMPFQTPLITLVGLRGNLFFIPILLVANRLSFSQMRGVICSMAGLNLIALGFGIAEYFQGVERFYPNNEVTYLIFLSKDVAGGHYRIPAIFNNAHGYASTMVASLPFLLGLFAMPGAPNWQRALSLCGASAALFGVLFANTRTNFIAASFMILAFVFFAKFKPLLKGLFFAVVVGVGIVAMSNERFQRFKSLEDTDALAGRLAGSVNRSFLEVITDYPLGNGLGGGGTSIPHFLASQVQRGVSVENEYARIALELGFPGFVLWLGFLGWVLVRGWSFHKQDRWANTRRLVWICAFVNFGLAVLGTGLLTAIPMTMMLLFSSGWLVTKPSPEDLGEISPSKEQPDLQEAEQQRIPSSV